ncbi:hypothetical protein POL68_06400 [Stigmatella sp. ncwal1]|uniref:Uncharacterized protein n=1 Tax=Stigmatella ashevillensis TaxID=2995309 RepID=A0ABT5D3F3_9BACT|nr:hypothetical protein [Stigmatella ashevillena]MDC0708096.1 hypothetical protein [Stigmatella ashevillena]
MSAVQRLEEAQARAQLMAVVERLSWGPVDGRDVDAAIERVAERYALGSRPAQLQDALQTLYALVAMRTGLSASLEEWSANRRQFEIGLRKSLLFFNEQEKKLIGSVAASLVHARSEPKGPVRTPLKGSVLPGSRKALVELLEGMVRPRVEDSPQVGAARQSLGALKTAVAFAAVDWTGGSTEVALAYVKAASSLIHAASGGVSSAEFDFAVEGMARLERVAALHGFPCHEIRLMDNLSKVIARKDVHGRRVSLKDWALALAGIPERAQGVAEGALLIDRFWQEISAAFEALSSRVPSSLKPVVMDAFEQVRTLAENAYWPARRSTGGTLLSQHLGGNPQEMKDALQHLQLSEGNARQVLNGLLSRFFDKGGIPAMPKLDAQKNWEKFLTHKLAEGDWQLLDSLHRFPHNRDLNVMAQSLAIKVRSFAVLFIDLERHAVVGL